jgi:hypothetical protein
MTLQSTAPERVAIPGGHKWPTHGPAVVTGRATYGGFGPVMPEPRKKPKEIVPAYQIPELAQADVPTLKLVVFDEASEVAELLELLEMAE